MKITSILLFFVTNLYAQTVTLVPTLEGTAIYLGIPFEGTLYISPYSEDPKKILSYFKSVDPTTGLYVVKTSDIKSFPDMNKIIISGLFSLFNTNPKITIDSRPYTFELPNGQFVQGDEAKAPFIFSHSMKESFWIKWGWWLVVGIIMLCLIGYLTKNLIFKYQARRKRKKELYYIKKLIKKASTRKEFEFLYFNQKKIYITLEEISNPSNYKEKMLHLKSFFQYIEDKLYVKNWNKNLIEELSSMKMKILKE